MAKRMRLLALEMAHKSGKNGAHLGGGLSAIEIMAALYGNVLKYDVTNPTDENRDRLVVSKGHCVLAYYTALYEAGFMTREELEGFEKSVVSNQSSELRTDSAQHGLKTDNLCHLHGHATRDLKHGIEFSGGSLSMGMSFAIGEALACKKKELSSRVFVLVGDGECDEGLIWESAMAAANYKLDNLTVIVDQNQLQYDGPTAEVMNQGSLTDKFRAFGFDTVEVDGHDVAPLSEELRGKSEKPRCVIAKTVKGKGVSFMEGVKEWHHGVLNDEQYEQAIAELNTEN